MADVVAAASRPIPDEFAVWAPGRVNLIGEHTDYNDGFVLPMAIERGLRLVVRRRPDRRAVLRSDREQAEAILDLDSPPTPGGGGWTAYQAGVIAGFQELGWRIPGFEAVVSGDLPVGGGLSSSAALEVATATAIETPCGRRRPGGERAATRVHSRPLYCRHAHTRPRTIAAVQEAYDDLVRPLVHHRW
jgi:galactokinase